MEDETKSRVSCRVCSKKANKSCVHGMCRGCCVTAREGGASYCAKHAWESEKRPMKAAAAAPQPQSSSSAAVTTSATADGSATTSASGTASTGRRGRRPTATPATSAAMLRTAVSATTAVSAAAAAAAAAAAVVPQTVVLARAPWFVSCPALAPQPACHPNIMAECPECGGQFCQLGSAPWAHLRDSCARRDWPTRVAHTALPALAQRQAHGTQPESAVTASVEAARKRFARNASITTRVFDSESPMSVRFRRPEPSKDSGWVLEKLREIVAEQEPPAKRGKPDSDLPAEIEAANATWHGRFEAVLSCRSLGELIEIHKNLSEAKALPLPESLPSVADPYDGEFPQLVTASL